MKKVLVVDDEADIGMLMKMMLTNAGYDVHYSSNLKAARTALKDHDFDFIFLDLNLNGEFGLNLLPDILSQDYTSQVTVITAQKDHDMRQLVHNRGIKCLIEKPFSKQQILKSITLGN